MMGATMFHKAAVRGACVAGLATLVVSAGFLAPGIAGAVWIDQGAENPAVAATPARLEILAILAGLVRVAGVLRIVQPVPLLLVTRIGPGADEFVVRSGGQREGAREPGGCCQEMAPGKG